MFDTLEHLLDARGPTSKAVVWAHSAAKRFIVDYWSQDWSDLSVSSIVLRLELMSHYAHACLPKQFDSFVWFDETSALTPLAPDSPRIGVPETYPFAP